jgi:hypothetical protein
MNHHPILNDHSWLDLHNKCLPLNRWNLKFTATEGNSILDANFALKALDDKVTRRDIRIAQKDVAIGQGNAQIEGDTCNSEIST